MAKARPLKSTDDIRLFHTAHNRLNGLDSISKNKKIKKVIVKQNFKLLMKIY